LCRQSICEQGFAFLHKPFRFIHRDLKAGGGNLKLGNGNLDAVDVVRGMRDDGRGLVNQLRYFERLG
jgi:hypothetical protein